MSTSLDIATSVLDAAILDFTLPVKSYNIYSRFIGSVELKNIDFAFHIVCLCCLQAKIYLFKVVPVWGPPS